eukprot:3768927-Rhodomonas_salina.2
MHTGVLRLSKEDGAAVNGGDDDAVDESVFAGNEACCRQTKTKKTAESCTEKRETFGGEKKREVTCGVSSAVQKSTSGRRKEARSEASVSRSSSVYLAHSTRQYQVYPAHSTREYKVYRAHSTHQYQVYLAHSTRQYQVYLAHSTRQYQVYPAHSARQYQVYLAHSARQYQVWFLVLDFGLRAGVHTECVGQCAGVVPLVPARRRRVALVLVAPHSLRGQDAVGGYGWAWSRHTTQGKVKSRHRVRRSRHRTRRSRHRTRISCHSTRRSRHRTRRSRHRTRRSRHSPKRSRHSPCQLSSRIHTPDREKHRPKESARA